MLCPVGAGLGQPDVYKRQLYTGYAVDVQARLAAHNAGKGAKYTPVSYTHLYQFLRRARGYAPVPVSVAAEGAAPAEGDVYKRQMR